MTLQGDLATLDLTSLFQSLEAAGKSGALTVRDEDEESRLFFERGKLALVARPRRPGLIEFLVAAGMVSAPALEQAKKQRRRGQTLAAALVEARAIPSERLTAAAAARLTDDAIEVLASGARKFEFSESETPPEGFDPEERALGLALDVSPLLLEAARRADHWELIREHVPSDSVRYKLEKAPRAPDDRGQARLLSQVTKLLDGSRTVREVIAQIPARRFEAYQLLADLSKSRTIRPLASSEVNGQVLELARRDKKRARALLDRALEQNPHNPDLLRTKAQLAEKMGEREEACEALKLVAHLQLEASQTNEARATLDRLRTLSPGDPFAWEKSFELALGEGRREDAAADAKSLAEMYRKVSLHRKVVGVLERLSELLGTKWEIVRELARARAAAGEPDAAVKGLEKYAASLIELESYPAACKAYEEVLAILPSRAKAKETLEFLKSGAIAQRGARRRRLRRRVTAYFVLLVVLPWLSTEALARAAYVDATRALVREPGAYAEARTRFEAVRARYGWTTTALFEVGPVLAELDARISEPHR